MMALAMANTWVGFPGNASDVYLECDVSCFG